MNRYIKKAFAAVALGTAGFVGGAFVVTSTAEDLVSTAKSCFPDGQPTEEELMESPCLEDLAGSLIKVTGACLAGGVLGFGAGLVLVGRKQKPQPPTPI